MTSVLLAHQAVGPKVRQLVHLIDAFPSTHFSTIVDSIDAVAAIADHFESSSSPSLALYIDIDCGMHRTGIGIDDLDNIAALKNRIQSYGRLSFAGFHIYDGHVHDASAESRQRQVDAISADIDRLLGAVPAERVIVGGSGTFAMWAERSEFHCSPGTTVFWDYGYQQSFAELPFQIAAALLTRVVSKPVAGHVCVDLGHKAIAAEMPLAQRVVFPAISDAKIVSQSEEHLVLETASADSLSIGDAIIALPQHICPTVALHRYATLVRGNRVSDERFQVAARDR